MQIALERGTPEQIALCESLFAGRLDTPEKLCHYFEGTHSRYARKLDPAILSPEPLNRAHGPDGFLRRLDLRPELGSITAPKLILAGRYDWVCAPEFSEEIHRLIPDSDLRIFGHGSHAIGGDEPQNFFDAVLGFVVYRTRTSLRAG